MKKSTTKDIWRKETPSANDVGAFTKASPRQTQAKLKELLLIVIGVAPKAEERISYKMPVYKYNGKWLVGFAGFKNHVSLFGMSGIFFGGFKTRLKDYRTSKGTLQFPFNKPLPVALIKMLVKARMKLRNDT